MHATIRCDCRLQHEPWSSSTFPPAQWSQHPSVIAIAPVPVDPADPFDEWLVEQIEALVDERFARVFRLAQRPWTEDDCPWHRRLKEIGMEDAPCPVCTQIARSRKVPGR